MGIALLVTALAIFVTVENWRGDRAWSAVEADFAVRGEPLTLAALPSPRVPDDRNFFKAPLLSRILYAEAGNPNGNVLLAPDSHLMDLPEVGRVLARQMSLTELRASLVKRGQLTGPPSDSPAADILRALQPLQPLLDELRDAARSRPLAAPDFAPTPSAKVPMISANTVWQLAQIQAMRALLELELGRTADARADLIAVHRFGHALTHRPTNLLHVLVGAAMHAAAAGVINEGCQRHLWSDADLAEFETHFAAIDELAALRTALALERAQMIEWIDAPPAASADRNLAPPPWLFHGWRQQNKVALCANLDREVFAAFTINPSHILSEKISSARPGKLSALAQLRSPHQWLSRIALPNLGSVLVGIGKTIDELTLSRVQWALERHRLAHRDYPATLAALTPAFLPAIPRGVFDGQPVHYTTRPQGGHQIYCLGQNGRDDVGQPDDLVRSIPALP